jgi:ABC-type dipeptide/oligopeptide/nickel transport system ATPase subunit
MNIKLHTPKSLKAGSGMASMKQFLLSIVATSISIALTFGTAAFLDNKKKQSEKREIVMMVMYDMYNSLKSIEKADSMIHQSMEIQRQIAEDTTKFETYKFEMVHLMPQVEYTETTERIFSSSIETINTVGNVLFTENVAEFYQNRQYYKTMVCDSVTNELTQTAAISTLKGTLNFSYLIYAVISTGTLNDMQQQYAQCKQMMEVSDEEIEAYRKQREQIDKGTSKGNEATDSIINEIKELQKSIDESKAKLLFSK